VVTGASDAPVRIAIDGDEVSVHPARELWGMDTIETQQALQETHGKLARTLAIGPAGERLSRIATIQTATSSVAGQGGFGAVMGAKKLKAITVIGRGKVRVADPERMQWLMREVGREVGGGRNRSRRLEALNRRLAEEGGGTARAFACTASCPTPCHVLYSDVPGCHFDRKWTGAMTCVSGTFRGGGRMGVYDWDVGLRGAIELNVYANRLGLNHWDLLVGLVPWLRMCNRWGMLPEINGRPFDLNNIAFWVELLETIALRRGIGEALADGGWQAAYHLGLGVELMRRYYTGWGYAGHWDGHAALVNRIVYPFWLVGALHWAVDTRDPASSTHGYVQNAMRWGPFGPGGEGKNASGEPAPITWDHMRAIGDRVYGEADALDPTSGYAGKAGPAAYHAVRSVMKDCLPTDDQVFPLIYSHNTPDRLCRIGDIDGPDVDAAILRAGTGLDWDTAAFEHAAERVLNLERAIVVRHFGRTRAMDERVLPYLSYDENWVNPEVGRRMRLERDKFLPVMDEYYRLRGWDVETGWPTRERLERLGLGGVHEPMVTGAQAAAERLPALAPERPVHDHHQFDPERDVRTSQG
jgi:aldehyde:ferredoxin oxidoreductase